jgi:hypothetical protein
VTKEKLDFECQEIVKNLQLDIDKLVQKKEEEA